MFASCFLIDCLVEVVLNGVHSWQSAPVLTHAFILSSLVTFAVLTALHFQVGRYLQRLITSNRQSTGSRIVSHEGHRLPSNEFADLFLSRETMAYALEQKQRLLGTQLDEAQQNLIKAAKLTTIGELTSTIVHDLRNPLQSIKGYAQIMAETEGPLDDKTQKHYLSRILRSADHIAKLVKRMSMYGRHSIEMNEGVNLDHCISDTLIILEPMIERSRTLVTQTLRDDFSLGWGNKELIVQILVNLCSNAIDAMTNQEEKTIQLSVKETEDQFLVSVTDSGTGVPPEIKEQIFSPFFTTKQEGKGTGLGLASCRDIVNQLKSNITVENLANGKGATFSFAVWKKEPVVQSEQDTAA